MHSFFYLDSSGSEHQIFYKPQSYNNLMEIIWDQGYEDWGDCKGRAWCATCHLKVSNTKLLPPSDKQELDRLSLLSNVTKHSRLACQILVDEKINALKFEYLGDD